MAQNALGAVRTWLDELADTEEQLAWLRAVTLEEQTASSLQRAPVDADEFPSPAEVEVVLLGEADDVQVEDLAKRVDSEPTLGGAFDSAVLRPAPDDAATVGVLALSPL